MANCGPLMPTPSYWLEALATHVTQEEAKIKCTYQLFFGKKVILNTHSTQSGLSFLPDATKLHPVYGCRVFITSSVSQFSRTLQKI
jgi:hypothetical protein